MNKRQIKKKIRRNRLSGVVRVVNAECPCCKWKAFSGKSPTSRYCKNNKPRYSYRCLDIETRKDLTGMAYKWIDRWTCPVCLTEFEYENSCL